MSRFDEAWRNYFFPDHSVRRLTVQILSSLLSCSPSGGYYSYDLFRLVAPTPVSSSSSGCDGPAPVPPTTSTTSAMPEGEPFTSTSDVDNEPDSPTKPPTTTEGTDEMYSYTTPTTGQSTDDSYTPSPDGDTSEVDTSTDPMPTPTSPEDDSPSPMDPAPSGGGDDDELLRLHNVARSDSCLVRFCSLPLRFLILSFLRCLVNGGFVDVC